MKTKTYLDLVECSEQPLDFCFHPKKDNLLAAALVDGSLEVHDIRRGQAEGNDDGDDDESDSILTSLSLHTQMVPEKGADSKKKAASCRVVNFSTDGERIFTGGSAGDLCCIHAERVCSFSMNPKDAVAWRIDRATEAQYSPLTTIHPFHTSLNLLATGDDIGGVRVWDERIRSGGGNSPLNKKALPQGCVLSWKENDDFISDMELSEDGNTLLASSADGRLAVFDLRMARDRSSNKKPDQKPFRLSDDQEDELLSLKIIKNGKKVVCGTQEGVLSIFSWGVWGDVSDRYPGHPSSIDALLKVDEDTLLTGSSDGHIRVVQIHPDKLLGVLGDGHGGFPVEKLDFNSNREVVGSISHDNHVHLLDARILQEGSDDEEDDQDSEDEKEESLKPSINAKFAVGGNNSDDDWDDMDEEDSESDDDSDSDDGDGEEVATVNDKRKKRMKTDTEKFFEDL